jgi:four helix bundle protein
VSSDELQVPCEDGLKSGATRRDNRIFSKELEGRTRAFAVSIIRLSSALPNSPEARVVRNQITRSGTSIGANYREANRARSKAEFKNRIKISESEASETQYWLDIVVSAGWLSQERIKPEYDECTELLALFSSIAKNT